MRVFHNFKIMKRKNLNGAIVWRATAAPKYCHVTKIFTTVKGLFLLGCHDLKILLFFSTFIITFAFNMNSNNFLYCSSSTDPNCLIKTIFGGTVLIFIVLSITNFFRNRSRKCENHIIHSEQLTLDTSNSNSNSNFHSNSDAQPHPQR